MRRVIKSIEFWILTVVLTAVAVVTIGYLVPIPYLSPWLEERSS